MVVGSREVGIGAGDHVVQFYERDSELADSVAEHLAGAVRAGGVAIVIATEAHRRAVGARLAAAGVDLGRAACERRLVWLDAAEVLARFMPEDRIDAEAFDREVASVVAGAAATARPVSVYGEMVELLWDTGKVVAALALESLWNDVVGEHRCSLMCAYRSSSVLGAEHTAALRHVCELHSSVLCAPHADEMQTDRRQLCGAEVTADFVPEPEAPGEARSFVSGVLRRWGHDAALVEDAHLVVSELATNAAIHARSPFSITVRRTRQGVLLTVADASPISSAIADQASPLASVRGLRVVAALASDWGTGSAVSGKTVWAELSATPIPPRRLSSGVRPSARGRRPDPHHAGRAATEARRLTVQVLDADPDLAAGMDPQRREHAARVAVAPVFAHPPGPWRYSPKADPATLGALVLDGLVIVRLEVGARAHVQLLGRGDVITPWIGMSPDLSVPSAITARVLSTAQIALLDRDFAERIARWPELHAALTKRLIARTRSVGLQAAVNALPRIDQRIELTLWLLADRFGRVTRDGITLNLPITHSQLAEMVAAHRPTVTAALSYLRAQGRVMRSSPNRWLLRGPAPTKLGVLNQRGALRTQSANLESPSI